MGYVETVFQGCQCPERPTFEELVDKKLIGGTIWECDTCGQMWQCWNVIHTNKGFHWKEYTPLPVEVSKPRTLATVLTTKPMILWGTWIAGFTTCMVWENVIR